MPAPESPASPVSGSGGVFVSPRRLSCALLSVGLSACCLGGAAADARTVTLAAGHSLVSAEVAEEPAALQKGLMHRSSLARDAGMLFVFPKTMRWCMWMKNTRLPLSVAFLDRGGRIINVAEMVPFSEELHCARGHAAYALEMNAGWFAARGVRPQDAVIQCDGNPTGLPAAPRQDAGAARACPVSR